MNEKDVDILAEELELPHNAWIDTEIGTVSFAIDKFTITFDIQEFMAFAGQIEDIAVVLSQMLVVETESCPTCGTQVEITSLAPPSNDDFH